MRPNIGPTAAYPVSNGRVRAAGRVRTRRVRGRSGAFTCRRASQRLASTRSKRAKIGPDRVAFPGRASGAPSASGSQPLHLCRRTRAVGHAYGEHGAGRDSPAVRTRPRSLHRRQLRLRLGADPAGDRLDVPITGRTTLTSGTRPGAWGRRIARPQISLGRHGGVAKGEFLSLDGKGSMTFGKGEPTLGLDATATLFRATEASLPIGTGSAKSSSTGTLSSTCSSTSATAQDGLFPAGRSRRWCGSTTPTSTAPTTPKPGGFSLTGTATVGLGNVLGFYSLKTLPQRS